jgi:peptidoglycan/xylan/chitin deacetylase (PgdA/CDA1 family)
VVVYFHRVYPEANRYTEITPQLFEYTLDLLLDRFKPLELSDLASWNLDAFTRKPSFVITLDDGFADNWKWAVPALEKRGLRAVFFVVTGKIEKGDSHAARMSWRQLTHLAKVGHLIGGHSVTHRPLTALSPREVEEEVLVSMAHVRAETSVGAPLFAYPYGRIPEAVSELPDYIGFGTVKSKAQPWRECKRNIRRTYFPAEQPEAWSTLVDNWRTQWEKQSA